MITVYGASGCRYCTLALDLLEGKHIEHEYIDVTKDTGAMKLFRENSLKTIPQVFLDNRHIGGYSELREYLNRGK